MSLSTLLSSAYSPATASEVHSSITYKPLRLHPNTPPPPPPPPPPSKPLTATQKRAQKINQIPKSVPPNTLRALHALWSGYATDLLRSTSSAAAAAQLMASAEFVGARIEVVRSACPSLVGIVGVCVVERRGVVYIACEESGRVRGVGKARSQHSYSPKLRSSVSDLPSPRHNQPTSRYDTSYPKEPHRPLPNPQVQYFQQH
ncbi:hypothetical protein B9Z19DRAFT_1106597 [Tuber borchii]|uniref:Uncharacterized protein n=1 Tax=Tuber borchii TaxID=42251 RepID=A0A2T7A0A0_TUBBO|nr:hypothetical protein B9Z19DRAFT_1106597 [Tuber borchii]